MEKEKLKTLKEMKHYKPKLIYGFASLEECEGGNLILKDKLKAEAVKWVKSYQEEMELTIAQSGKSFGLERTIYALKKFFNLTEEDLK